MKRKGLEEMVGLGLQKGEGRPRKDLPEPLSSFEKGSDRPALSTHSIL